MKKTLAVFTLLTVAAGANAADLNTGKTYVGGDLGLNKMKYKKSSGLDGVAEDKLPSMNLYVGHNVSENFAVEGGFYTTAEKKNKFNNGADSSKTKEYAMYVDAVGKYQVSQNAKLLGTAGVQYGKFKSKTSTSKHADKDLGLRLGVGAEYAVSEKANVRGMARYVSSDYNKAVDREMQYTVGLNYSF